MASKYTREQVTHEKRCGIRYFDEAVQSTSRAGVIEGAIQLYLGSPPIWGDGWPNFHWALGNFVRQHLRAQGETSMTFNADEVLTPEELSYVAVECDIAGDYAPMWQRRVPRAATTRPKAEKPAKAPPKTVWDRLGEDTF